VFIFQNIYIKHFVLAAAAQYAQITDPWKCQTAPPESLSTKTCKQAQDIPTQFLTHTMAAGLQFVSLEELGFRYPTSNKDSMSQALSFTTT